MGLWPFKRADDGSPAASMREMGMSIDEFAGTFFKFDGNSYSAGGGGGAEAWQFGGVLETGSRIPDEEIASDDYEAMVGGLYKACPPIFAAHNHRRTVFSEARLSLQKVSNGRPGQLVEKDSADTKILREPWPGGTSRDLFTRAIIHADIGGNAFMVRDTIDGVDQIRLLRPDWVLILMSGDPTQDSHIRPLAIVYKPGNTQNVQQWDIYPFDGSNGRVAHWAPIPDPVAMYRGMSWMTPIIREGVTDKGISLQKLRYFQQGARPGIIGSFDKDVSAEQAYEFQEKFYQTKIGSQNAYKPLFIGGGCTLTELKVNVEDFDVVAGTSELRIAAAAQVPAVLVGLGIEALKGSATSFQQGNFQAAKDAFIDGLMRPLWGHFAETVQKLIDVPDGYRLGYDDRDISYLREDQEQVAKRKEIDAATITQLVRDGFKWKSAVEYVLQDDLSLLEHTEMFSVQLMPPGIAHALGFDGVDQATANADKAAKAEAAQGEEGESKDPPKKPIANNYGSGSSKQAGPGRPKK